MIIKSPTTFLKVAAMIYYMSLQQKPLINICYTAGMKLNTTHSSISSQTKTFNTVIPRIWYEAELTTAHSQLIPSEELQHLHCSLFTTTSPTMSTVNNAHT
jgi:hypothetical protein